LLAQYVLKWQIAKPFKKVGKQEEYITEQQPGFCHFNTSDCKKENGLFKIKFKNCPLCKEADQSTWEQKSYMQ
jgi:hypothetical protein